MIHIDPCEYAHCSAMECWLEDSVEAINHCVDQHLLVIIDNYDIPTMTRIVATWLSTYDLPIDPVLLKNFDRYHSLCQPYVTKAYKENIKILPYTRKGPAVSI